MKLKKRDKKNEQKVENLVIKIKPFTKLLNRINLGGIIEDCIININGKKGYIEAVDITNSVIIISEESILKSKVSKLKFGFNNIDILVKFLKTISDTQIEAKNQNNKLIIKRKDSKRSLDYLLADPEMIATKPNKDNSNEDIKSKLIEQQEYSASLNEIFIKDFLSYINLSKTKDVFIHYKPKDENIEFICGNENEHQLKLTLESKVNTLNKTKDNIKLYFDGNFLSKIFNIIEFDKDKEPLIYIANERPVIVEANNTIWALTPKVESEGE